MTVIGTCLTLNFKCFTTGLGNKVTVLHTKLKTWQFAFPHDSDLPVISTFDNFSLTK